MLKRKDLEQNYVLQPSATAELIEQVQALVSIRLPEEYTNLMLECNGLYSAGDGRLAIHPIEEMPDRNADYEISTYLPEFFMIGDDSGGRAILINEAGEIYEVGMGSLLREDLEKSAVSLEELLINYGGKTLNERDD